MVNLGTLANLLGPRDAVVYRISNMDEERIYSASREIPMSREDANIFHSPDIKTLAVKLSNFKLDQLDNYILNLVNFPFEFITNGLIYRSLSGEDFSYLATHFYKSAQRRLEKHQQTIRVFGEDPLADSQSRVAKFRKPHSIKPSNR